MSRQEKRKKTDEIAEIIVSHTETYVQDIPGLDTNQ